MIDDKDRAELLEIFDSLVSRVRKTIQEEVMPATISKSLERTGITIGFRKLNQKTAQGETDEQPDPKQI